MGMRAETIAAKRGAKLLDQYCPGWVKKVDASELNMGNSHMCILGQAYDGFSDGCKELVADAIRKELNQSPLRKVRSAGDETVAEVLADSAQIDIDYSYYGFDAINGRPNAASSDNESYDLLAQQWLREIAKRKPVRRKAAK